MVSATRSFCMALAKGGAMAEDMFEGVAFVVITCDRGALRAGGSVDVATAGTKDLEPREVGSLLAAVAAILPSDGPRVTAHAAVPVPSVVTC